MTENSMNESVMALKIEILSNRWKIAGFTIEFPFEPTFPYRVIRKMKEKNHYRPKVRDTKLLDF